MDMFQYMGCKELDMTEQLNWTELNHNWTEHGYNRAKGAYQFTHF